MSCSSSRSRLVVAFVFGMYVVGGSGVKGDYKGASSLAMGEAMLNDRETRVEDCRSDEKGNNLLMLDTKVGKGQETLVEDTGEKPQLRQHQHSGTRAGGSLTNLQAMVKEVVGGGKKLDNVSRLALKSIETLMYDIIDDTKSDHSTAQTRFQFIAGQIQNCSLTAAADMTKAGGVDQLKGEADEARTSHATCRAGQKTRLTQKVATCNDFQTKAAELAAPAGCAVTFPSSPSASVKAYMEGIAAWLKTANETYAPKEQACDSETASYAETKNDCDDRQTVFETKFCNLAQSLTTVCNAQTRCREEHNSTRGEDVKLEVIEGQARAAEYDAAKKVLCLLVVLNASAAEMPSKLDACDKATYTTSHLDVDYGTVADATPCDTTPVESTGCDDAFKETEYSSLTSWYGHSEKNAYTSETETVRPKECKAVCPTASEVQTSWPPVAASNLVFFVDPGDASAFDGVSANQIKNLAPSGTLSYASFAASTKKGSVDGRGVLQDNGGDDTGIRTSTAIVGGSVSSSWTAGVWLYDVGTDHGGWAHLITDGSSKDILALQSNGNVDTSMHHFINGEVVYMTDYFGKTANGWHEFTLTWDSDTKKLDLYLDGVSKYSQSKTISPDFIIDTFYGYGSSSGGFKYTGSFGITFAFNKALTASEVTTMYQNNHARILGQA